MAAGLVEQGRLQRTEGRCPQGGVVSPLLLNVALRGMETAAEVRYHQTGNSAGKADTAPAPAPAPASASSTLAPLAIAAIAALDSRRYCWRRA